MLAISFDISIFTILNLYQFSDDQDFLATVLKYKMYRVVSFQFFAFVIYIKVIEVDIKLIKILTIGTEVC